MRSESLRNPADGVGSFPAVAVGSFPAVAALVVAAWSTGAHAQLWDPVAGKARPHMIVGFDTSVTMGITSDCSNCHERTPGIRTRLDDAKAEILATLPLFERYFYYGGFQYRGCGSAHVVEPTIRPDRDRPEASFAAVERMIDGVRHCNDRESQLPGGGINPFCLTPTENCIGDRAKLAQILGGGVPGLSIPVPGANVTATCVAGSAQGNTLTLEQLLVDQFGRTQWERWDTFVSLERARDDFCAPLQRGLAQIRSHLESCYGGDAAAAAAIWDLRDIEAASHCRPELIQNACRNGSAMEGTCMCDDQQPNCVPESANVSACDMPLLFRARQQVGVCTSYSDETFGDFFRNDPDNIAARRGRGCRENVALFFTDGYAGTSPMVAAEADVARTAFYESRQVDERGLRRSNMFLFHVSTTFQDDARAMARAFRNPVFQATDRNVMMSSFAEMTNRVYAGQYVGANVTADRSGTRLAVHSFEVPSGTGDDGERYLGRPSRLAVYEVDPRSGAPRDQPRYATDWRDRVRGGVRTLCTGAFTGGCTLDARERALFGAPPGAGAAPFLNGVERAQDVPALPGERSARRWGVMLGGASTQPVIVDHPHDPPSEQAAAAYGAFAQSARVVGRPRMVFVMSNTFLHAFHMGARVGGRPDLGPLGQRLAYTYDDDPARTDAGRELFRFFPRRWLRADAVDPAQAVPGFNDVVVQPLITGQIQVADLQVARLRDPGPLDRKFATILAVAQGRTGRGMATLDVTDPSAPRLMAEWLLPVGDRASSEPTLVQWPPATVDGPPRPAVVMTSGLGARERFLRVYHAQTGALITQLGPLPGAGELATEPTCLDVTGSRAITHCYALSTAGNLYRIEVSASGQLQAPDSIEPPGVVGDQRRFMTRPIVFFGSDGAVNVAFGSGLSTDFSEGSDSARNRFYKVVDRFNRSSRAAGDAVSDGVCFHGGRAQSGIIELGRRRVVSPPVVSKGVVAFTTYEPADSACEAGGAELWAMDFARCTDVIGVAGAPPTPVPLRSSPGIPGSPVILRGSERIITQTSGAPIGQLEDRAVRTRGGDRTLLRRLFWRPEVEAE